MGFGEQKHRGDTALRSHAIEGTCSQPESSPWTPTLNTWLWSVWQVSPLWGHDFPALDSLLVGRSAHSGVRIQVSRNDYLSTSSLHPRCTAPDSLYSHFRVARQRPSLRGHNSSRNTRARLGHLQWEGTAPHTQPYPPMSHTTGNSTLEIHSFGVDEVVMNGLIELVY